VKAAQNWNYWNHNLRLRNYGLVASYLLLGTDYLTFWTNKFSGGTQKNVNFEKKEI